MNVHVDTYKLNELPLPVVSLNLEGLMWHFDMPIWSKDGTTDWNLTPQEVIDRKPQTRVRQQRVEDADITYPIVVTNFKSKLVILDGVHRMVKVYLNGNKTITVKVTPASYLEKDEFKT